jgi:hypothetical protein
MASYNQASDQDILEGLLWYHDAHDFAAELADSTGLDLVTVCAVIAALSPQTQWTANKAAAVEFLKNGTRYPSMLVENFARAGRVLMAHPVEALAALQPNGPETAPKIAAFARNILGDEERVTVDTWAVRAALGEGVEHDKFLSRVGMYEAIAAQYRWLARKVGVSAPQAQAIVWIVTKRELDHRTVAAAHRRAA